MERKITPKTPTGGCSGLFKRFWYHLCFLAVGFKWNLKEIFTRHKKFNIQKIPRREGDVAVITGGARGIGVEVIRQLLVLNMHVIIGCRKEKDGNNVVDKLRQDGILTGSAHVINLDLTSLESVREFSGKVLKRCKKINILINNAGIMLAPYDITKDDFESHFQVNYLSHFLLTQLLLPKLKSTGTSVKPSRIVNVSSAAAYGGKINFDDLQMTQLYSPSLAYMSSKMMQLVFTRDLETRLKNQETNVHVYAVHPGVVKTDLYKHVCWARVFSCFTRLIFKSPKQGSDCVLYAALSPKVANKGGNFFANSSKVSLPSKAKDFELQQNLWRISCDLTGLPRGKEASPTTFSIENEKISAHLGDIDSDNNRYETKSTDVGSLDEVEIENQAKINQDIAKNIIENLENDISSKDSAIVAISKEFVEEVVEKGENIVNEQVQTSPDFIPITEEVSQEIVSEEKIQVNSTEISSNENSNIIVSADSIDEQTKANDAENNSEEKEVGSEEIPESSTDKIGFEVTDMPPKVILTNTQETTMKVSPSTESFTKDYGSVSITEMDDDNNEPEGNSDGKRMRPPRITITHSSDVPSDSESDGEGSRKRNQSVTIVEAS